jgi:hypothetical protein
MGGSSIVGFSQVLLKAVAVVVGKERDVVGITVMKLKVMTIDECNKG